MVVKKEKKKKKTQPPHNKVPRVAKNPQTECAQLLPIFAILKKDLHVCS